MAENTRMKELQAEVKNNSAELKRLMDLMELRDQEQRAFTAQVQTDANARMTQLQNIIETMVQNRSQQTGGSNSTSTTNEAIPIRTAFQVKDVVLEFPRFDGHNVLHWIFTAEQFFDYHHTPDEDIVAIAGIHLDKDVVPWFQMIQRTTPFRTWNDLTQALESQFGPSPFDCPMAELFKLQQTGSVSDYYLKFMSLANRSQGLSDEAVLACFLSGLHTEIRRDVVAQSLVSLLRAVALAKLYEERYLPIQKHHTPIQSTKVHSTSYQQPIQHSNISRNLPKQTLPPLLPTPPQKPQFQTPRPNNIKRMSPAEMQLRREKGLCYFCDDKFTFNHKCPNRQFLMLQNEDEGNQVCSELEAMEPEEVLVETPENEHHLSLNALKGGTGVGNIRFSAQIQGRMIKVLVDGGSSDNFIQPRIAKFLKLPIEATPPFKVVVGNGSYMTAEGFIKDLVVQVQGVDLTLSAYVLPVSGADLILGGKWLATLGLHMANYEDPMLKFLLKGKFVTLQGESANAPVQAEFHQLRRLSYTDAISEIYTIQLNKPETIEIHELPLPEDMEPELVLLLHTYKEVFAKPSGLPPPPKIT